MNKKIWRDIHRWTGVLLAGFVVFYCFTGLLLNHRQGLDYFQVDEKKMSKIEVPDLLEIERFIETCKEKIGREESPKVIRIKDGGIIEFLYGSHGRITYVIDSKAGTMTKIEKSDRQPWYWLNSLHKVYRTSDSWRFLADAVALFLLFLNMTGLFLLRYTRQDFFLLFGGLTLLLIGFVIA